MSCSVADQYCDAPANLLDVKTPKSMCFACGLPVCTKCSTRRKYLHWGRVRVCNNCQVDRYSDGLFRVMFRIARMGKYPPAVAKAIAELWVKRYGKKE